MSTTTQASAVPAVPLNALAAVKDENTRIVLQSIIDGWQVRNAAAGDGRNAFVTRGDLVDITGARQTDGFKGIFPTFADYAKNFVGGAAPGAVVADIEASLQESLLFQQLGQSVSLLNQNITAEQQARVAAVQAVADNLAAETLARAGLGTTLGGQIATLQDATDDNATLITALGTWADGAQSSITSLNTTTSTTATNLTALTTRVTGAESSITTLNTTTGNQAQTLASLSTRVGDAESSITTLNTTTGNQANTLTTISTTLGQKANTYFQAAAPTGTIATGSLWFDSDDNNKPYRWDGTAWALIESAVSLAGVNAAITAEQDARVSADNAITESVNSQFTSVNGTIANLNSKTTTLTTTFSALANYMVDLTAQFDATQATVQQEAEARADADGVLFARYSIKTDVNGYVSGYGLLSTANNSVPTSEFIVRADKFAIGSPSGPGITPRIPFTVLTTPDAKGNQPGVYMDNVVIKAASITGAYIADLAVDTLKIADNAVIIPDYTVGYKSLDYVTIKYVSYQREYYWADTGALLTTAELLAARAKASSYVRTAITTVNPHQATIPKVYCEVANFPPRDYAGQPVLILHDIIFSMNANYTGALVLSRVEQSGSRNPLPDEFVKYYIPRDIMEVIDNGGGDDMWMSIMDNATYTSSHEASRVWSTSYETYPPGVKTYNSDGFFYDYPPAGTMWNYVLHFEYFLQSTDDLYSMSVQAKLATMGLKK